MICHHCHHVYAALVADLRELQARAVSDAITPRERVHVEGEIAALERAIRVLVGP